LDLRGRKWREVGEDCIMRRFITSSIIIRITKSMRMRGVRHAARMGKRRNA
jgi:hypothetical protein